MKKIYASLIILLQLSDVATASARSLPVDSIYPTVGNTHGGVAINAAQNDASALLDLVSTTKGFLPPRMTTTQKNAISSPTTGLVLYDSSLNQLQIYTGSAWTAAGAGGISYAADTGSANAYAIAPATPAIAYNAGDMYAFKVANANTTSSTLNVSSLGTKNIKTPQIANLPANALLANAIAIVVYDGTQFQLVNQQDPSRVSALTTKGDTHSFSTVDTRHAAPADYGSIVADSTAADGLRNVTSIQLNGRLGKNYVQFSDFENNSTTGWTAMGCATITNGLPFCNGSGGADLSSSNGGRAKGANTSSPAIDSSSAIAGTYAMNLATTGAGTAGDGHVSKSFPIDPADRGKAFSYNVSYKVASGTPVQGGTSADTYAIAIYSPADNAFLNNANPFPFTQSGPTTAQGTFQTLKTTTSVQFFVYNPVAPAGASSFLFDDVGAFSQILPTGPPFTTPTAYTPTFTGFGTATNINFLYWQEGAQGCVRGNFTAGTVTATEARVSLPSGWTTPSTLPTLSVVAPVEINNQATTFFGAFTTIEPSVTYFTFSQQTSVNNALQKGNGSTIFGTGNTISLTQACVPISGFSSNVTMDSSVRNAPTVQTFTSGTAATYITPPGVKYLEVIMWGGGGGGGGSGTTSGTAAGAGSSTTFGTSLLTAPGGSAGSRGSAGGVGGVAPTIASPAIDYGDSKVGNSGGSAGQNAAVTTVGNPGGTGGGSGCGGGGTEGGGTSATGGGDTAPTNSGGGGGGGSIVNISSGQAGSGGGGGACVHALIPNPSASYTYTVALSDATHGQGQLAGTSGAAGGAGASGKITVIEHYLNAGTIAASGPSIVTKSANYTATTQDSTIVFTSAATLSLPPVAQVPGQIYHVVGNGAAPTIDPNASDTVCGQPTILVPSGESVDIQSDGTAWQGLGNSCFAQETVLGDQSANCTSGTCTSTSKSGGLSSVTFSSTGVYSINFVSGTFSAVPVCMPSASRNNGLFCVANQSRSASSVLVGCYTSSTGAAGNDNITAICRGPR